MNRKRIPSPDPLPSDWRTRLAESISSLSRYSRHPKEKDLMLQWLHDEFPRQDSLKEAAEIVWEESKKRRWNIEDPPDFYEHFEYLLLSLAISVTTSGTSMSAKALEVKVKELESLRNSNPFFRKGEAGEQLEREINVAKTDARLAPKTKPRTPERRIALAFLSDYLRDVLEMKYSHQVARLLLYVGHSVMWSRRTIRSRASEARFGVKPGET